MVAMQTILENQLLFNYYFVLHQAGDTEILLMRLLILILPLGNTHQVKCAQYAFNLYAITVVKDI